MEFKCPTCGNTDLCFHTVTKEKTPLSFENGKFEPGGKVEEIDINDDAPLIRCGNGHALEFMSDEGYVENCDDMVAWLEEREQIEENL